MATRVNIRVWIALALVAACAALVYATLRPGSDFSPISGVGRFSAQPASSASGPGEWAMEGRDPGRTRAADVEVATPLRQRVEIAIPTDPASGSPITVARGALYVETEDKMSALDLETGKLRWRVDQNGSYISPAVAGDMVYMRVELANKGTVFALAGATGAERWRFSPKRIATPANGFWGGHLTSPVVSGGKVYIGAGQEIYALDAKTGALRWQFNGPDLVSSSVAVSEGRVFFSGEKNLHAIDASSGTPLWKAPVENEIYFAPIAADGVVYTTTGGKLAAYDARSGAQRWASREEDSGVGPAALAVGKLYAVSKAGLRAVDAATGKDLWSYQFNGYVSMPAVVVGKLFVVTGSSAKMKLAALDAATGKVVWEQQIPSLAAAPPVLGDGTVYVRTTDGRVLGFSQ